MMRVTAVLLAGVALLAGCAFSNHTVTRPYRPHGGGGWVTVPLELVRFELRPTVAAEPAAIGVKKNGYGWDTAYIFSEPPASDWLLAGLKAELEAHGVVLRTVAGDPRLSVTVEQFLVEPDVGFWGARLHAFAVAEVEVQVGGRTLSRRFVAHRRDSMLMWLDEDFERALLEVARELLASVAREVSSLLEAEGFADAP